jgi:hypothetical protein
MKGRAALKQKRRPVIGWSVGATAKSRHDRLRLRARSQSLRDLSYQLLRRAD